MTARCPATVKNSSGRIGPDGARNSRLRHSSSVSTGASLSRTSRVGVIRL
jgi:hypothetical protein